MKLPTLYPGSARGPNFCRIVGIGTGTRHPQKDPLQCLILDGPRDTKSGYSIPLSPARTHGDLPSVERKQQLIDTVRVTGTLAINGEASGMSPQSCRESPLTMHTGSE